MRRPLRSKAFTNRPANRFQGMSKLFMLIGSTIGSYAGWWMGAHIGMMTAFAVSMVGTGAGIYYGRQLAQRYE